MYLAVDEGSKRRLTEPIEIETAVDILESRGVRRDQLFEELTRIFYVDLDELKRVLEHS